MGPTAATQAPRTLSSASISQRPLGGRPRRHVARTETHAACRRATGPAAVAASRKARRRTSARGSRRDAAARRGAEPNRDGRGGRAARQARPLRADRGRRRCAHRPVARRGRCAHGPGVADVALQCRGDAAAERLDAMENPQGRPDCSRAEASMAGSVRATLTSARDIVDS
jgi:hypothetical protein